MRPIILLILAAAVAPAQIVSVGVKAGVPATAALPYYGSSDTSLLDTGRWTIGPTVEVRLLYGFSFEADALYRAYRVQESFALSGFILPATSSQTGVTYPPIFSTFHSDTKVWDFPFLLKYRFGKRSMRPFVDAGYTWSHSSSDETSSLTCLGSADACTSSGLSAYFHSFSHTNFTRTQGGPTAGAGMEFKLGKFKLAPEVRYTRFIDPRVNQVTVLAGFTF
jgi:hypothetical protein